MTLVTRPSDRQGMAFPASIDPRDRLHVCSGQAVLGSFEISTDDPEFATAGPIGSQPVLAFPREPVRIHYEGRNPFISDPTVVNLYNPWQAYRREPIGPPRYASDWIEIEPRILAEARPSLAETLESPFPQTHQPVPKRLYLGLRLLIRRLESGDREGLFVEESFLNLLDDVLESIFGDRPPDPGEKPRVKQERIHHVKEILATDPTAEHHLDDLAQAVTCSKFYLCRLFREQTGTTVHQYQTDLRLRLSLQRLTEGESDLNNLASDLGFASHSHFTATFRRTFGITPSHFRGVNTVSEIDRLRRILP